MKEKLTILRREPHPSRSCTIGDLHINAPGGERVFYDKWMEAWCFACRKRGKHQLVALTAEWYEPEFFWACPHCGKDRTHFGDSR